MAKKSNTQRIKKEKYHTDEQIEVIRFVKILVILIVLVVGVYFFTRIFVTKDLFNQEKDQDTAVQGEINYNITLIGNMFNKPEEEYYIMMYDTEDINAVYYSGMITNYSRNEKALKIYFADLSNGLNKKYVTDDSTSVKVNTMNFEDFKVGELALIKVSKGKIEKSLVEEEAIAKELAYQKENK